MKGISLVILLAHCTSSAVGYSSTLFEPVVTKQRTAPSKTAGVDIELPDFDRLFDSIQQVSPLARSVMEKKQGGFAAINNDDNMGWKTVEKKPKRIVQQIDKIDHFQGESAPVLRFRGSFEGPCVGEYFADFIMNYDMRSLWDPQIAQVYEIHPINDLDAANIAMGFGHRYGDCSRLGIGYCQTKPAGVITSREQLTLCGIQDFIDGSCIVWGTEMEDRCNHLLPDGARHTRARSRIFSTTLQPTGPNSFDVEYVLQLDIGGKIPYWLNAPVITETVKNLFRTSQEYFKGRDGHMDRFLEKKAESDNLFAKHSLLMPP